ncbi:hypothetical protein B0T14DRAFT_500400 [Immersiella caudata]|uniref:Uncharacterized protein n=1 Tax=Immersiella caudata TaxID=314043 RepID=A0AA39WBY8_9PEZI|nr:hypothetical protein B0T14DRAFT_500400 [Immersiella caudata]
MPNLTTADIAFLLCTSQQQKPSQRFHLTLTTAYGLVIRLGANDSLTADLSTSTSTTDESDATPTTPTPRSKLPFSSKPAPTSIDSILHNPHHISPETFNLAFPPASSKKKSSLPLSPGQGYKYRIYPDKHGASHVWYAPGWPGNPQTGAKRVREADLEMRYSGEWFEAYLDWAERLEEAMQRRGRGWDGVKGKREPFFVDEGERMLWMVEGLLLACWLSLQGDVGAVEYQPAGAVFVVEGGTLGRVLRRVLGGI